MNKEELIITEKFEEYQGYKLENLYLNLYSDNVIDPIKAKLLNVFSCFHSTVNCCLIELNKRIETNHYFRADDSKFLNEIINEIFDLIANLRGTKYDFRINKSYYFYLKNTKNYLQRGGTKIPEDVKPIEIIKYERIFTILNDVSEYISVSDDVDEILKKVSSRNMSFINMEVDEKIDSLNRAIENILKNDKKYIKTDSSFLFLNFITDDQIREYRTLTNCFRHGSDEMIKERAKYTEAQKVFLINYGLTICNSLMASLKVQQ